MGRSTRISTARVAAAEKEKRTRDLGALGLLIFQVVALVCDQYPGRSGGDGGAKTVAALKKVVRAENEFRGWERVRVGASLDDFDISRPQSWEPLLQLIRPRPPAAGDVAFEGGHVNP